MIFKVISLRIMRAYLSYLRWPKLEKLTHNHRETILKPDQQNSIWYIFLKNYIIFKNLFAKGSSIRPESVSYLMQLGKIEDLTSLARNMPSGGISKRVKTPPIRRR